jgi:glucosamine--fructose-6-phosphate aminotransferase (isomerizing)
MTTFDSDLVSQGAAIRRVLQRYGDESNVELAEARALGLGAPQVVFAAMGSSLSAALPAATRLARSQPTAVMEAGELLHYGIEGIKRGTVLVLVSQSGRSAETLALGQRMRAAGDVRILAITNDEDSPLAELADVVLPMLAGPEMAVATKTFMTTFVVVHALVDALTADPDPFIRAAITCDLPSVVDAVAADGDPAARAAELFNEIHSIVMVARGPDCRAADSGGWVDKETAGLPAEAMPGGSFRHGPMEIVGPGVGLVVLAPSGCTRELGVRLAVETSEMGGPTWLIGTDRDPLPPGTDTLLITGLPDLPERFAPLTSSVPIQRLAAALAVRNGREPGVLRRSQKVTDIE